MPFSSSSIFDDTYVLCYFCGNRILQSNAEKLKNCDGKIVGNSSWMCKSSCPKRSSLNSSYQCAIHGAYAGSYPSLELLTIRFHSGGHTVACRKAAEELHCKQCGIQAQVKADINEFNVKNGGRDFVYYSRNFYCQGCYASLIKQVGEFSLSAPGVPYEGSLGVEVELAWDLQGAEKRKEVIDAIYDLKQIIAKKDGSIGDGVEFVSSPIDIDKQKDLWKKASQYFKKYFKTHDNCGMHVHVSRDALKLNELYKLMLMIHDPANKELLQKIGGRSLNAYCQIRGRAEVDKLFVKKLPVGKLLVPKEKLPDSGHYDILSLSPRHPTVEFRWFASSTDDREIIGNIETVCALKDYSHKISLKEPSVQKFLDYFKASELSDKYPLAQKKLKKVGVI